MIRMFVNSNLPVRPGQDPKPRRTRQTTLALFISLLFIGKAIFVQSQALQKITVNYAARTGPTWPLYIAKNGGYYEKYGLDVRLVYGVHPAGIAMIVNGEAAMANYGLEQSMQAGSKDGSLVVYSSPFKKGLLVMMANDRIGSVSDLKGKRIGVRQIGDLPYTSAVRLLAKARLTARDVQWLSVGTGGDTLAAAIVSGRVDAAPLSAPAYFKLEAQGFRTLARLSDFADIYSPTVFLFKKSTVEANPQLPELLIKAHAEAIKRFYEDKAFAVKTYLTYNKEDPAEVDKVYELYKEANAYEQVPYILAPAVRYMIDHPVDDSTSAQMRKFDFRTVIDNSIIDRLVKTHFFEGLFGPAIKLEQQQKAKIAFR